MSDMKKLLLRRISSDQSADRYTYTVDDIPKDELEKIKEQSLNIL